MYTSRSGQPDGHDSMDNGATQSAQMDGRHMQVHKKTASGVLITGLVVVALLVVMVAYFAMKAEKCGKNGFTDHWMMGAPAGNLVTGGNNPYPFLQMGDAGWGGPLHSTYQSGDSRVFGAANANHPGDDIVTAPVGYVNCKSHYDPTALGEARVLYESQALDEAMPFSKMDQGGSPANLGYTAKGLDDSALMQLMTQGGA